jgi:hypothetical protein
LECVAALQKPAQSKANSEISLTLFVRAITVEFDRVAGSFAGSATVFASGLRLAGARRILAFLFVSHNFLLGSSVKID